MSRQKIERIFFIVIMAMLSLLLIDTCNTAKSIEGKANLLEQENVKMKIKMLDDSSVIYMQERVIVESDEQMYSLREELSKMGVVNAQMAIQLKARSVFKTEVDFDRPVTEVDSSKPCPDFGSYLKLPSRFTQSDRYYSLDGAVTGKGRLKIDSLVMIADITFASGDTSRAGFLNRVFGKKDKVVSVMIDNPYISVTGMKNYVVRNEKKWYETQGAAAIFGFAGGFALRSWAK